jgi:hypothetical protein
LWRYQIYTKGTYVMNCDQLEILFSERFDDALSATDRTAFESHLLDCSGCQAKWQEYREAVEILQTSGTTTTSSELLATTLAVVDADAKRTSAGLAKRRLLGLLIASAAGAAAALFLGWLLLDANRNDLIEITLGSKQLRVQRGDHILESGVVIARSEDGKLLVHAEPASPKIVERIVEVPVEVPVEVRVEVPVDRIVEIPVETIVRRGPLFTIETGGLAAALADASKQLSKGMQAIASARKSAPSRPELPIAIPPAQLAQTNIDMTAFASSATIRIERSDGRLRLETSGTIDEIVPALLDRLDTDDFDVCALIQNRLAEIHDDASDDPNIAASLASLPIVDRTRNLSTDLLGRITESEPKDPDSALWREWWQANQELLTATESP